MYVPKTNEEFQYNKSVLLMLKTSLYDNVAKRDTN